MIRVSTWQHPWGRFRLQLWSLDYIELFLGLVHIDPKKCVDALRGTSCFWAGCWEHVIASLKDLEKKEAEEKAAAEAKAKEEEEAKKKAEEEERELEEQAQRFREQRAMMMRAKARIVSEDILESLSY